MANFPSLNSIARISNKRSITHRSHGFFFQTDILIRLVKSGYLFAEVPYRLNLRKEGLSKAVSFPSFIQVVKGYLRLIKEIYFNRTTKMLDVFSDDSLTAKRREKI